MNIPDMTKNKTLYIALGGLCVFIVMIVIFQAGVLVGYNKAQFAERMAGEYARNFGGGSYMPDMLGKDVPGGHGATGKVIQLKLPLIEVADSNNIEKEIVLSTSTMIRRMREVMTSNDIRVDDHVVVIGSPNEKGQIDAKLVRLIPPPGSKR